MSNIVGILLAAGQSTRFGKDNKLLAPLTDGTPLVIAAAQPLQMTLSRVIAVIPANEPSLHQLLTAHGIEVIPCTDSTKGIGASIACGVHASTNASGWLIALGDMPCISSGVVRQIVNALNSGSPLVRPVHNNRVGHPAGFSRAFRSELLQLENDTGGHSIFERHTSSLHLIPVKNDSIHRDIDTRANLKEF